MAIFLKWKDVRLHASVDPNPPGRSGCGYDRRPVCHDCLLHQFAFVSTSRIAIRDDFRHRCIGGPCDVLRGQCRWQSVAGRLLNRALGLGHISSRADTGNDSLECGSLVLAEDHGIHEMKHDTRCLALCRDFA